MTPSEKRHLEVLWRGAMSAKDIARRLGYSEKTVLAYAEAHRDRCPYRKKQTRPEVRDVWVDRIRNRKCSIKQAADALGVSQTTVWGWLKRMS